MKNHLMMEMKRISSSRVFSATLATLIASIFSADLHAGASNKNGNPFGNGTFFSNTATFSAVVRGDNLSGTVYFSTGVSTNTFDAGSQGSTVIVYEGNTYNGNASGMWNPSSSVISGQIWGGQTLSGPGSTTVWPEIYNTTNVSGTNGFPRPIQVVSNVIGTNIVYDIYGISNTTVTNILVTNTIYVEPVGINKFNDSVYMNGSFYGNVQNSYPNQTFSAYGTLLQTELIPQATGSSVTNNEGTVPVQLATPLNIPVSVQGVRISDEITTYATVSNSIPYSQTTYSVTNFSTFK
jgi:hypothetical protein